MYLGSGLGIAVIWNSYLFFWDCRIDKFHNPPDVEALFSLETRILCPEVWEYLIW